MSNKCFRQGDVFLKEIDELPKDIEKKDRKEHGNNIQGSKSSNTNINEDIAKEIYDSNLSLQKTANKFGISKKAVLLIKQKKTWKHIHDELPKEVILAVGETSFHKHVLVCQSGINEIVSNKGRYVDIQNDALLVHEEHDKINIEKGKYQVIQQRELDLSAEVRQVLD